MNRIILSSLIIIFSLVTNGHYPTGNYNPFINTSVFSPLSPGLFQTADSKDYGDAPISYGTADHIINYKNYLGSAVDGEPVYQPSSAADEDDLNGKDDEDGVIFPEMVVGTKVTVPITVVGAAYLNVWIDWNSDGDFRDNGERILTDALKSTGTFNMSVTVPANAIVSKPTFARFRFGPKSTAKPVYGSSGSARYGEVEDYQIKILCSPLSAPKLGAITQPNCELTTGSVVLSGLPATGIWTLIRTPGGVTTTGTGTSKTISGLAPDTYNYTVTDVKGCTSAPSDDIVILVNPAAQTPPLPETIIQPDCNVSVGSVVLSGLPETGIWTLTRSPDGVTSTGTGTSKIIPDLVAGTYKFTVTNSAGCTSVESTGVVINAPPDIPAIPVVGTITPPTCTSSTGIVILNNLPATGIWILTRYPGTITSVGEGTSTTITGLEAGTYNYNITNSSGCFSAPSANIVIPAQPDIPAAPVTGNITQPTFTVLTGSVVLTGLPLTGTWTVTRIPDVVTTTGTGSNVTISDLPEGVFTFTVTNSAGCTSTESNEVIISTPGISTLIITDPATVCAPATVDLTISAVTAGSTPGLTYTYWTDADATITYSTPAAASEGTYYIKGTTGSGFFNIKPVIVAVDEMPIPNAGEDQILDYQFNTLLNADHKGNETGFWSLVSGAATFNDNTDPKTAVSRLSLGKNILLWAVTNGVCPTVSDQVQINVNDLLIPTLITPNGGPYNEYFVLRGIESLGKTELVIFDRRGAQVYRNMNYDNSWNGLDYNGKELPEDTYFYLLKPGNGKSLSGFIVIRR